MTKTAKTKKDKDAPLGRDDWTEAAWQMLGKGSLDQVRVDALARHLKVTRGSFYWHFRDRDDLIEAILQRWYAILGLEQSMMPALRNTADPALRLWIVYERVIREVGNSQFTALRLWARGNPAARKRLEDEDRKRLDHMVQQFQAMGFTAVEAQSRGDIYQALVQGEFMRNGTLSLVARLRRAKAQHDALMRR